MEVSMSSPGQSVAVARERPERQRMSRYLLAVGLVVMLAGLLFGYDQGVISGALDGIKKSFHPSTFVIEIITSWVTLGAMAGALAAGALTERMGRRFTASTQSSHPPTNAGIFALVGMVVFIGSFAFSLGPVVWTVINEVFPSHVRGRGVAVATAVNWLAAWLVAQIFLSLVDAITTQFTFLLFAGFCAITFAFVKWFVPETKGKTLEEVQQMWSDPEALHQAITSWA
jgi:MFS family permease